MNPVEVDEITGLGSYLKSVDWSERWFLGLGTFHVICALLTIFTKSHGTSQTLHFAVMLLLVYSAKYINEWAAKNYRLFAEQQYFDSNGLFISLVFSVPILLNCLVIVILWLWNVGHLIADVKRLKYKVKAKYQSKIDKSEKKPEEQTEESQKEK
ncbi:transmembrane protein 18 [Octopus bimaculoides]|uniref:Transmembrane protein 18 n=1 Tax=Octopus bimaculoides TaxID=37653 RepID=A0A0L8G359_OCTBM|nr:transmembrane protein 18 [Octopus bimaculoides]|eukprot:XP_014784512.1 PREDICTED: transmembrane protein 18-like [Octopus bimaculoides]